MIRCHFMRLIDVDDQVNRAGVIRQICLLVTVSDGIRLQL
jgi:hypothetical protein